MLDLDFMPSQKEIDVFAGRDILDIASLSKEQIETIMKVAAHYERALHNRTRLYDMDGKVMAALFYEPSTRTRLSFEAAMLRLGGNVITVSESNESKTSSSAKGETIHDAISVIDNYCDVIVCRSPINDVRYVVSQTATVPVINAGDGSGQHPSQALLDMYTIFKEKGSPDGLTFSLIGDLKYGRTVHSLVDALAHYDIKKLVLASPKELKMPTEFCESLRRKGTIIEECDNIEDAVSQSDVIYMTRVQMERFPDKDEYNRIKDCFIIKGEHVKLFPEGAILLHPLPRVNEIEIEVDNYPGAAYFRQAGNGLPTRMAMLALVTGSIHL